jgi:ribonuclease HI
LLLLWRAWYLRNNVIHGDGKATIRQSADFLINYAHELKLTNAQSPNRKGKALVSQEGVATIYPEFGIAGPLDIGSCKWEKPGVGIVKINVDGSFVPGNDQASIGVVARNTYGEVIFSAARKLDYCSSAEEAELEAIKEGLVLAEIWVPGLVICETDCSEAVKVINEPSRNLSSLCHLINDIKEKRTSDQVISISFVKREGNGVAHSLATQARINNSVGFWLNCIPVASKLLVWEDCNSAAM